ncbi:MAG: DNA recombination protein RmuC [Alphaproteobacteria bacterium]
MEIFIAAVFGAIVGFIATKLYMDKERRELAQNYILYKEKVTALNGHITEKNEAYNALQDEMKALQETNLEKERQLATFIAEKKGLEERIANHKEDVQKLHASFKDQFENLAQDIFKKNSQDFSQKSNKDLEVLLNPLKEKIGDFKKRVEETYQEESREKVRLGEQIKTMTMMNQKMSLEAENLTKALRGDNKKQGNWGEVVLEKILEDSGLIEGQNYTLQGKGMGLKSEDGKRAMPDVIINLPQNRHVVIDSKLSLLSYEKFSAAEDDDEKEEQLKLFINSTKAHINGLSGKDYNKALEKEGSTLDWVFMFIPIEGAFFLAVQNELDSVAWDKNIALVGPTTLMYCLRIIQSLWQQESQSKNALDIASQGGMLYDKFVGFVEDLQRIGKSIEGTQKSYDSAMNKLTTGTGNLVSRTERIKKLGAKTAKSLPQDLVGTEDTSLSTEKDAPLLEG